MVDGIAWLTPSPATTLGPDWWASASDLEKWSAVRPDNMVRHVSVPKPTPQALERIADDARQSRGLSAQRAETVAIRCPKCGTDAGVVCNGRISRHSARKSLRGFHVERFEAAFAKAKPTAEKPATAAAPSATAPAKPAPKKTTAKSAQRAKPSNLGDFAFMERRFVEARKRSAHARGDYLTGGIDHARPVPRIKYRPAAIAAARVSVGPKPWAEIKRLVRSASGAHEVGGALLGHVSPAMTLQGRVFPPVVHVLRALPPAADAVMTHDSLARHIDRNLIAQLQGETPNSLAVVGGWHTHTTSLEPSRADMLAMADNREVAGITSPIELIVSASGADARAWIVGESDDPRFDYDCRIGELTRKLS